MGHGVWTRKNFADYAAKTGRTLAADGSVDGCYSAQEMYKSRKLSPVLDPKGVIRECCDSDDHPNTIPVILALDVTGSMGSSAVEFAKKLNVIMTELYSRVRDVEFMVMGIGDVMYDAAPVQASQFESDIRIAEQLDELFFEHGGGGNNFESYTAAWYFGARHTKLDCWKRGKKGIIITIGDELINPYIPVRGRSCSFAAYMGDELQSDIDSRMLLNEVSDKYELYHLVADHSPAAHFRVENNVNSFAEYIGANHVSVVTLETLADTIVNIVASGNTCNIETAPHSKPNDPFTSAPGLISW